MSDAAPVVHIGENSPEQVAYKLMKELYVHDKPTTNGPGVWRKHVLDLYAECLDAVQGKRIVPKP